MVPALPSTEIVMPVYPPPSEAGFFCRRRGAPPRPPDDVCRRWPRRSFVLPPFPLIPSRRVSSSPRDASSICLIFLEVRLRLNLTLSFPCDDTVRLILPVSYRMRNSFSRSFPPLQHPARNAGSQRQCRSFWDPPIALLSQLPTLAQLLCHFSRCVTEQPVPLPEPRASDRSFAHTALPSYSRGYRASRNQCLSPFTFFNRSKVALHGLLKISLAPNL